MGMGTRSADVVAGRCTNAVTVRVDGQDGQWVGNGWAMGMNQQNGNGCGKAKSDMAVGRIFEVFGVRIVQNI